MGDEGCHFGINVVYNMHDYRKTRENQSFGKMKQENQVLEKACFPNQIIEGKLESDEVS